MKYSEARIVELTDEEKYLVDTRFNEHFCYHYQPQYELSTGKLRGFECLLRLEHPTLGIMTPKHFLADIRARNVWSRLWPVMLSKISKDQKVLDSETKLAINVSPEELEKGTDSPFVMSFYCLSVEGIIDPTRIEIEITEDFKIRDYEAVNESITALQTLGATVSVDDFGAGFCNLAVIEKLNVDGVKIDQGIIQGLETSQIKQTIVKSLVEIAKVKDCFILAEGIETKFQLDCALRIGCNYGQGYFLGRPTPSFVHEVQFKKAARRDSLTISTSYT